MKTLILFISLISLAFSLDYNVISKGYTWAENLRVDPIRNALFVSDARAGTLTRITYNNVTRQYHSEIWLEGFDGILGVVIVPPAYRTMYVVAHNGTNYVLRLDTLFPNDVKVICETPKLGNGLAMHFDTQKLFVCSEGSFLPGNGLVYVVDVTFGTVSVAFKQFAADGAFIDQERGILYVSQVVGSKMISYDILAEKIIHEWYPDHVTMIDDFCLSPDGSVIYAADFWKGNIASFKADGTGNTQILVSGLNHPTSVRFGDGGNGFNSTSLFVTEGGGLFKSTTNRRVLEIPIN
eukprot:TRINITY_DN8309_c0_g1_i1.p1 TRINITY_DN8309_c0_g1~~TRINITY_DN8309_c0_g1_i1.p1  ORF type:complete len:294 (-),score=49.62 TRINITY_DN8309_c0_g1_i1:27-908(-)